MKAPQIARHEFLAGLVFASGYKQREVAKAGGIDVRTLQNALAGRYDLSEEAIEGIARFFRMLPERVLELPKGEWEEVGS